MVGAVCGTIWNFPYNRQTHRLPSDSIVFFWSISAKIVALAFTILHDYPLRRPLPLFPLLRPFNRSYPHLFSFYIQYLVGYSSAFPSRIRIARRGQSRATRHSYRCDSRALLHFSVTYSIRLHSMYGIAVSRMQPQEAAIISLPL